MITTDQTPRTPEKEIADIFGGLGRDYSYARSRATQVATGLRGLHLLLSGLSVFEPFAIPTKELVAAIEGGGDHEGRLYHDYVGERATLPPYRTIGYAFTAMCESNGLSTVEVGDFLASGEGFLGPVTAEHPTARQRHLSEGVWGERPLHVLAHDLTVYMGHGV